MPFSKQSGELLEIWKKNWKERGWDPLILNEEYANTHPLIGSISIDDFNSNLYKHHTLRPIYHKHCFLRWLAFHKYVIDNGSVLWADYDVYNKDLTYENFLKIKPSPQIFCWSCCSGYLNLDIGYEIARFFKIISTSNDLNKIDGIDENSKNMIIEAANEKRLSDMPIIQALFYTSCNKITSSFKKSEGDYKNYSLYHLHGGLRSKKTKKSLSIDIPYEKKLDRASLVNFIVKQYLY